MSAARERGWWLRWGAVALVVVGALFNYRGMADYTRVMFNSPIEDMSHGWAVPVISIYAIWRQRRELRAAAGAPSWRGFGVVVLSLGLAWIGGRGGQSRLEQVSLIGLVWSVPYAFWGWGVARLMLFPVGYLFFTIPVSSFIDFFTIHLRLMSMTFAIWLANWVGVPVESSGIALVSKIPGHEFRINVVEACSGIRSLAAIAALTGAYAYFSQRGWWRKWTLFVFSLPFAVVGNIVRLLIVCILANQFGEKVATGFYHDLSGFATFLLSVPMMIGVGSLLKRAQWGERSSEAKVGCTGGESGAGSGRVIAVMAVLVVVVSLITFWFRVTIAPPEYNESVGVVSELPVEVCEFVGIKPWFCHERQCLKMVSERELDEGSGERLCPVCGGELHEVSLSEWSDLPRDTKVLKSNYVAADGLVYGVSVAISGKSRNSIHRAELCLPAQGFTMQGASKQTLILADGRKLRVRIIDVARRDGGNMTLIYWFFADGTECCSHSERILLDVWNRSFHNKINRWVMVAISVNGSLETPEALERLSKFVSEFYGKILVPESE